MTDPPKASTDRTSPRVVFNRNREVIWAELIEGWSARAIYQRHAEKLVGIGLRQFTRYAAELRSQMSLQPNRPNAPPPILTPSRLPTTTTTTTPEQGSTESGQRNTDRGSGFDFKPSPQGRQWKRPGESSD